MLLLDGQVHHDTHAIPMGNYVIEAGNYVIATPSQLGNCMIADNGSGHLVSRSIQRATPVILRAVEQVHQRAAQTTWLRGSEVSCPIQRESSPT